ncbi:MAG: DoxX family membrane protein [Actinobacteria bacterium]|nr:DoxX family membrane protein [Actinomycetota bacterium]
MAYGLLLLRLLVGLAFAAHGAQKLFGWFGGGGPAGTAGFFASLGYRAPALLALLAGLAELGGGLLLASGLATPLAALALATVMLNAIVTVKWREGFLSGYELEATYLIIVVSLAATGPGRLSLDRALGWDDNITGTAWGSVVLVGAIVIAVVTTTLGRGRADTGEMAA